jgi:hypothetical protein
VSLAGLPIVELDDECQWFMADAAVAPDNSAAVASTMVFLASFSIILLEAVAKFFETCRAN